MSRTPVVVWFGISTFRENLLLRFVSPPLVGGSIGVVLRRILARPSRCVLNDGILSAVGMVFGYRQKTKPAARGSL